MKKAIFGLVFALLIFIASGCASTPHDFSTIYDDSLVKGMAESETSLLVIYCHLNIKKFDDTAVDWHPTKDGSYFNIKIPAGRHTLFFDYEPPRFHSYHRDYGLEYPFLFEAGKKYALLVRPAPGSAGNSTQFWQLVYKFCEMDDAGKIKEEDIRKNSVFGK